MDISKKKPFYPISAKLRGYLSNHDRASDLPVSYDDLTRWQTGFPLYDANGNDTFWESVIYDQSILSDINRGLTQIYALLKTDGDMSVMEHLYVDRIDYCHFGNSKPFRIRIVNHFNDNYDYFYLKMADASRIYGLELEHILSPNRINYLVCGNTLIEEHIAGIPGDQFILDYIKRPNFNKVRLAKEFVKFNERCFVRLLGDMRSYNYVIDVTPDFDAEQYRVRAIDFDQQCYEGRKNMYLPQFFKENLPIVNFCIEVMTPETVRQYQYEERILIRKRYESARFKIKEVMDCIKDDNISTARKTTDLIKELNKYHQTDVFSKCRNVGQVLEVHLEKMLTKPKPNPLSGKTAYRIK